MMQYNEGEGEKVGETVRKEREKRKGERREERNKGGIQNKVKMISIKVASHTTIKGSPNRNENKINISKYQKANNLKLKA